MSTKARIPQHGQAHSGDNWTVAIGGNKSTFVKRAKADFNSPFEALIGSA